MAVDEIQEGGAEFVVEGRGAALGDLAVGHDSRDAGAWGGALRERVQVRGGWVVGFGEGRGLEAVGDGEEAEVGDAEVVGEGAGDAALAEGEEFVVAFEDGAEESGGQEEDEGRAEGEAEAGGFHGQDVQQDVRMLVCCHSHVGLPLSYKR